MPFSFPHEAVSLINELGASIPPPLKSRYLERVRKLLSGDEILSPGKIVEACKTVQAELLRAPETAEPPVVRPTRPQTRGPWRMRA